MNINECLSLIKQATHNDQFIVPARTNKHKLILSDKAGSEKAQARVVKELVKAYEGAADQFGLSERQVREQATQVFGKAKKISMTDAGVLNNRLNMIRHGKAVPNYEPMPSEPSSDSLDSYMEEVDLPPSSTAPTTDYKAGTEEPAAPTFTIGSPAPKPMVDTTPRPHDLEARLASAAPKEAPAPEASPEQKLQMETVTHLFDAILRNKSIPKELKKPEAQDKLRDSMSLLLKDPQVLKTKEWKAVANHPLLADRGRVLEESLAKYKHKHASVEALRTMHLTIVNMGFRAQFMEALRGINESPLQPQDKATLKAVIEMFHQVGSGTIPRNLVNTTDMVGRRVPDSPKKALSPDMTMLVKDFERLYESRAMHGTEAQNAISHYVNILPRVEEMMQDATRRSDTDTLETLTQVRTMLMKCVRGDEWLAFKAQH